VQAVDFTHGQSFGEAQGKKTAGQLLDELNGWRKILNGERGKN